MFKYSKRSENALSTCHILLQRLFRTVLQKYNHKILKGHITRREQYDLHKMKRSKYKFPNSPHNKKPSLAVRVVPFFEKYPKGKQTPLNWKEPEIRDIELRIFADRVKEIAKRIKIDIKWGGDNSEEEEKDFCYYELEIDEELFEYKMNIAVRNLEKYFESSMVA